MTTLCCATATMFDGDGMKKKLVTLADIPLSAVKAERRASSEATEKQRRARNTVDLVKTPARRKAEAAAEKLRLKEKERRINLDLANLKVDPIDGQAPSGAVIRVNRNTGAGHLLSMHRQQPDVWTKPMVDAGARFGRDYDLSEFRGLSGMGLEPKVDSFGEKDVAATGIVARMRLRQLRERVGDDYYGILVLVCGIGFTFTELKAHRIGDKRALSDRLRTALNKAAAFYGGLKEEPVSDFLRRAHRLINEIKNKS